MTVDLGPKTLQYLLTHCKTCVLGNYALLDSVIIHVIPAKAASWLGHARNDHMQHSQIEIPDGIAWQCPVNQNRDNSAESRANPRIIA